MIDEYKTIKSFSEGLFKDKGSKFHGFAFPAKNEEEIKAHIDLLKINHPKARHFCYAFKLGHQEATFRANDDGEPSGSAGKPILNTIQSFDLTNTLVVVVRYFGGTLLGVPGLIHAYKEATKEALIAAEIETKTINSLVEINYDFEQTNVVMQTIRKLELKIVEQTYQDRCGLVIEVRNTYIEKIKEALKDYWDIEIKVLL
jgi:uncharacterized YigZ family protein